MPNAFITAYKLRRNGPISIIAHSHANLKLRRNTDIGSYDYLFMLISQVTHPCPVTCHFKRLNVAVMAVPMRSAAILPEQLFLSGYIIKKHNNY